MCDDCRRLLSEGLDLCVRARKLDEMDRAILVSEMRGVEPRSGTIPLWVQDQYERDLADWERRARQHLTKGCPAQDAKDGRP